MKTEIDEICDRINLLKKKFVEEICKVDSDRILSKSLEEYFTPLLADKAMFLASLDSDIIRLDQNLA